MARKKRFSLMKLLQLLHQQSVVKMPQQSTTTLIIIIVIQIIHLLFHIVIDDDGWNCNYYNDAGIGDVTAKDIFNDIRNTPYFNHWVNCPPNMYDEIKINKL